VTTVGDLCTWRSVELRGGLVAKPVVRTMAWCLGDWATHQMPDLPRRWALTLLPLGLCLPTDWASFNRAGAAVSAMREIVRVRNDWHAIAQTDLTTALKHRLREICHRHGALSSGPVGFAAAADRDFFGREAARLNGYGA